MARTDIDDLDLLATRLHLGLPLTGFDGRDIPLRHPDGREVDPVEAAVAMLMSGASLLPTSAGRACIDDALERAYAVEASVLMAGESTVVATAKVTAVLVSAAIRASVRARATYASPSDMNQATLSWYSVHDAQRRELLDASAGMRGDRLSA
jgi:hypothetical protein